MPIDTNDPKLNPAKEAAIAWAQYRANRTKSAHKVWVSPPGSEASFSSALHPHNAGANVWYVRSFGEPGPADASLFCVVEPEKKI